MNRKQVVFLAPGAGLGHIVRVSAIACSLAEMNTSSLIVTTSKWAQALSKITNIPTVTFTTNNWDKYVDQYLIESEASVIVQDTFPFGFRNRTLEKFAEKKQFVYLARYLNTEAYFERLEKNWNTASPLLSTIIEIEPLEEHQNKLISESQSNHFIIENRIRFPFDKFPQQIPEILQQTLSTKKTHLIVHTGPEQETNKLIMTAKEQIENNEEEEIAIINPIFAEMREKNAYDFFPAAILFPEAYKLYTGGGYNCIAETEPFIKKTTYLSFPRYYDDQQARINGIKNTPKTQGEKESGAIQTAEIILSLIQ